MNIPIEHLGVPPKDYEQRYFANMVRALESALRRVDFAEQYDPEVQRTDDDNPSKALYSTGGTKLDENFTPTDDKHIVPKNYIDEINTALQAALETLDAARTAAEAALQDAIDEIKGDASLITFDHTATTNLTVAEDDVQAAIAKLAEDSGVLVYTKGTGVPLSAVEVEAAINELAGNSDGPTSANIYIRAADYDGVLTDLAAIIDDIDARLTGGAL